MTIDRLRRRSLLLAAASLALPRAARAEAEPYELRDLTVPAVRKGMGRFLLLVPRHASGPVPLLVVFHGKGETGNAALGVRAWVDRYGLGTSYARLLAPPVAPELPKWVHWRPERLTEINTRLAQRPFGGLAVACPYVPDVFGLPDRVRFLDDFARWVVDEVVARTRRETPILEGARHVGVDGVSLGGFVSIEVFLRRPEAFGAFGMVQSAFGASLADHYGKALARTVDRVGPRRIHLETSLGDVYREDNERLSKRLGKLGVPHDFVAPPGYHNQPFLRDSGTLEMLLWHDRALRD